MLGKRALDDDDSSSKNTKRKGDDVSCDACGTQTTSAWRKGPNGPGTLCNNCGNKLYRGTLQWPPNSKPTDVSSSKVPHLAETHHAGFTTMGTSTIPLLSSPQLGSESLVTLSALCSAMKCKPQNIRSKLNRYGLTFYQAAPNKEWYDHEHVPNSCRSLTSVIPLSTVKHLGLK